MKYNINLSWDNDSSVWIATSEDVKGLVLESGSIDALIERVKINIPILLSMNAQKQEDPLSVIFHLERQEMIYA